MNDSAAARETALTYEEFSAKAESELRALEAEAVACCRAAGLTAVPGSGSALAEVFFIAGAPASPAAPFTGEARVAFESSLFRLGMPGGWARTAAARRCASGGACPHEQCPFIIAELDLVAPKLVVFAGEEAAAAAGAGGLAPYEPSRLAPDRIGLLALPMAEVLATSEAKKRFWDAFKEAVALAREVGLG